MRRDELIEEIGNRVRDMVPGDNPELTDEQVDDVAAEMDDFIHETVDGAEEDESEAERSEEISGKE